MNALAVPSTDLNATPTLSTPAKAVSWVAQLVAAAILGQTLFFKFTGAPETVALFEVVGLGDTGRIGTAVTELVAVVLLLVPRTAWAGGLLAMGVLSGAILSHLTRLGISIDPVALGDPRLEPLAGPGLFVLGVVAFALGGVVVFLRRGQVSVVGARLARVGPAWGQGRARA